MDVFIQTALHPSP